MNRLLILIFCTMVSISYADAIYKYVDENGNVSYSATPPADNEEVESLEPAPEVSVDELKAAHDRLQKMQTFLDESESARTRRNAASIPNGGIPAGNNPLPNFPPLAGH